jgi:lambda family phage portal protein
MIASLWRTVARWMRGARRLRGTQWARSYSGASSGPLAADFAATDMHINQALYRSLRVLRARSRELARNSDYARAFLRMVRVNVVGPDGFGLQVHARKRNGELDTEDSTRCEKAFAAWGARESCDYCGRLSWLEMQGLYIETLARDGEVLVRRLRGSGPWGYQLQMLDPALLDETYCADLPGGRRVRMGIELDRDNRPLAYYLSDDDRSDPRKISVYGRSYVRVPADEIWHDFLVEYPGQLRGVPWMACTLIRQKRLAAFEAAALAAAEEGAKKLAWIKTPDGRLTPLADTQAGDGEPGMPQPTSGTLYTESGEGVHYAGLPPGYDVTQWDPRYPDQAFADFVKAQLRGVASGLGVSYHSLANDLEGVNFSSTRAGVLEEREVWKSLQAWMIERFCARVYSEWLPLAILSGKLNLPMDKLAKFDAAVWQGRRWSWVDPLRDIEANVVAIRNGLTSRARVIRDMGHDPEEIWAELRREKDQLDGLLVDQKQTDASSQSPQEDASNWRAGNCA